MTSFSRSILVLGVALALGCGGESPGETDGGLMDGSAPPTDGMMTMPDAGPPALCAADSECDDGLYCNGAETCMIGAAGAGADGCLAGSAPCDTAMGESCDEAGDACVSGSCDGAAADLDGDGDDRIECGGSDCDDGNSSVYGTAQEVCDADGLDEDCDPSTIQDDTADDGDMDGDGFIATMCFNTRSDGGENRGDDCDDGRPTINVDGVEACDGRDNDCDTMIDEDVLETFYRDADGDNFGDDTMTMMDCTAPMGWVFAGGDCADRDRTIHPGATELCDGIDNDCTGTADDGSMACRCTTGDSRDCGPLARLDGVGICRRSSQRCVAGAWPSECPGAVYPESTDGCGGGDEDCDGMEDEDGLLPYYRDMDRDGYGDPRRRMDYCRGDEPSTYVANNRDCDDSTSTGPAINPDAREVCDGVDNDCMGGIDDVAGGCGGCTFRDTRSCGTDTGDCVAGTQTCSATGTWGGCVGATVAEPHEQCGGGDEDCDGDANDADSDITSLLASETGANVYWRDMDGDNHGVDSDTVNRCGGAPTGYVAPRPDMSDCNDTPGEGVDAHFGLNEADYTCDGIDNDCDGTTDEVGTDSISCYLDADSDSYGGETTGIQVCGSCPSGRIEQGDDCRDDIAVVRPNQWRFFSAPACPVGTTPVSCGGGSRCGDCSGPLAEWDYNCDDDVEPQTNGFCRASGLGECVYGRGPDPSIARPSPSACGLGVDFVTGCSVSGVTTTCTISRQVLECQ